MNKLQLFRVNDFKQKDMQNLKSYTNYIKWTYSEEVPHISEVLSSNRGATTDILIDVLHGFLQSLRPSSGIIYDRFLPNSFQLFIYL
jgi:hypothetical protein